MKTNFKILKYSTIYFSDLNLQLNLVSEINKKKLFCFIKNERYLRMNNKTILFERISKVISLNRCSSTIKFGRYLQTNNKMMWFERIFKLNPNSKKTPK